LEVPTEVSPLAFFEWCADDYRSSLWRPELLDHILGLINERSEHDPLPPVPLELLERAGLVEGLQKLALENLRSSAAELARTRSVGGGSSEVTGHIVRRHGSAGKVCPIEAEIIEARRTVLRNRQEATAGDVREVLLQMAKDTNRFPRLRRSTDDRILLWYDTDGPNGGEVREYTLSRLRQYLAGLDAREAKGKADEGSRSTL
jgi:hypothetical protein